METYRVYLSLLRKRDGLTYVANRSIGIKITNMYKHNLLAEREGRKELNLLYFTTTVALRVVRGVQAKVWHRLRTTNGAKGASARTA